MAGERGDGRDGAEGGRHGGHGPAARDDAAGFGSATPRRDTRGIVDAEGLLSRVRFRRRAAAEPLRPYVEHYWLIDWDLEQPFLSQVVPHPSVNVVFQRYGARPPLGEVAGVGLGLFSISLEGRGRVCGVQFRPGGFRPFLARSGRGTVAALTGRRDPLTDVFPDEGGASGRVLTPGEEDARVEALDAFLLRLGPEEDAAAERAMRLVHRVRTDRGLNRVGQLARSEGVSVRSLQRLFADCVGVSPKWVILRYRIHEAMEQAAGRTDVDWARLAGELGYSDQAHLVRDFTDTVGLTPTEYVRAALRSQPSRA
jgi:AraC-like DNA-binding protein